MKRGAFMLIAFLTACGGGSSTPSAPAPVGSASPAPTATASAAPPSTGASPGASPAALSFGSGSAQNVTVTESKYTGAFTESDTCNPYSGEIASVAAGANGAGSATYAVTPQGAGTCTITVTDGVGRATAINVTVSSAAITLQ